MKKYLKRERKTERKEMKIDKNFAALASKNLYWNNLYKSLCSFSCRPFLMLIFKWAFENHPVSQADATTNCAYFIDRSNFFYVGPPGEDIFFDHHLWSIFQSSLHTCYKISTPYMKASNPNDSIHFYLFSECSH